MTDTPGLLRRPEEERNAMERLTLAALAYLPTAAVFVTDLTGDCGTSVADQWAIRCVISYILLPSMSSIQFIDINLSRNLHASDLNTVEKSLQARTVMSVDTIAKSRAQLPSVCVLEVRCLCSLAGVCG